MSNDLYKCAVEKGMAEPEQRMGKHRRLWMVGRAKRGMAVLPQPHCGHVSSIGGAFELRRAAAPCRLVRRTMAKHSDSAHYDSLFCSGLGDRGNVEPFVRRQS